MPGPQRAGRFDIADIVRAHRAALESAYTLSPEQKRVLTDITNCRTAALGGHVDVCIDCGYECPAYNSCRNRHCPKCQALAQEQWIGAQRARMLDVKHFHVVFTLPAELRPLARFAPRLVYDALFYAAGRTLLEFGERRLSAKIGATVVLHTWTRDLRFHPHVHAIVTGGGLALDGRRWNAGHRRFLFPVKAMGLVFRGKMMDRLRDAYNHGDLAGFDAFRDPEGFDRLLRGIAAKNWNVYAKPSFDNGEHVLQSLGRYTHRPCVESRRLLDVTPSEKRDHVVQYLGRYTHRVGIANSRLLDVTPSSVTFRTKGDGVVTLPVVEFLARFIQHVLPRGFHKIRHVGLHASKDPRELARSVLGSALALAPQMSWSERLHQLTGRDLSTCPRCGALLVSVAILVSVARAPPEIAA
jgi:hypothetical protein